MPGRSRGRAAAPRRDAPVDDARPGDPGHGGHPDDGYDGYYGYDDGRDHDGPPPAARRNGSGPPPGTARNGAPGVRNGHGPAGRGPLRDDDHEPSYARDHTPLGYDGGDPDDPPLFTHGQDAGPDPRGRDDDYDEDEDEDEDDEYYDDDLDDGEYEGDAYGDEDDYDEGYDEGDDEGDDDEEYDNEEYDDDAYGVGDGPLAVPPPGSGGRPLGPADVEELDPSMTDALARVDLGAMQVPVPFGADLSLEPAEGGRPQAVHLMLPEGRIAVSALAAPRSSGLWPELADEIEESLRGGGARVRGATGDWGRELHARTDNASSVFIGADGPRWMVYGVATASLETVEALDVELRRVMRGIVVVRGKLPYPPRTVLPLERAEDRAEAQAAAQSKPRGASITVSVPAARTSGATPAAARDGAPLEAPTTRTPAAGNGAVRDPAAGNGRSVPGRPGPDLPGPARAGRGTGSAGRPAADGGRPDEPARRPAASQPQRPPRGPGRGRAPGEETVVARGPRDPETTAVQAVRRAPDAGGVQGGGPAGPVAPQEAGTRPGPQAGDGRAGTGRGAEPSGAADGRPAATGTGRGAAVRPDRDVERTGAVRRRVEEAPRRRADETGAAPARRGAEAAEAATPRRGVEQTGAVAARGRPEDTGTRGRRGAERSGAVASGRRGGPEDSGAARRPGADTGAAHARSRPPEHEPVPEYEPEAPVTQMLPTVDAPGAGHTDAQPVVEPVTDPRTRSSRGGPDDLRRSAPDTGRSPVERPEPVFPALDEPPARRDPAVTALPGLPGADPGPTRAGPDVGHGRHPAHDDGTRDPVTPAAGLPLADEPTPRGGTGHRFAGGADPWDPVDAGYPRGPISRMAIEDIPLSDVELLDATLDSEPAPEPGPEPERLPRRRPGATRRRAAPTPSEEERAGRRRRGAEDDVLSGWMSAEIAARPSGRHAQPGHSAGAAANGAPRRSRGAGRATDRPGDADLVRGADLFRSADGAGADGAGAEGTGADGADEGRRYRRNGRARTGTDGAVDPMTLFSTARDPGRHRRG